MVAELGISAGKPLNRMIRGKFRDAVKEAGLYQPVPKNAWKQQWICDIKAVGNR